MLYSVIVRFSVPAWRHGLYFSFVEPFPNPNANLHVDFVLLNTATSKRMHHQGQGMRADGIR